MSNKRRGLKMVESIAVVGSLGGSVAAFVFQQAIYGLAPVSLSLLLNLINRHDLEQRLQQTQVWEEQIEPLKREIEEIEAAHAQTQQTVRDAVSREEFSAAISNLEAIDEQQKGLRLALSPIQSRLDDLIEQFHHRPELEQIENLANVIVALKRGIDALPQPERSQQELTALRSQVERLSAQLSETTNRHQQNSQRIERLENVLVRLQRRLTKPQ
jgi:chromosome segregation ATPase